MANPKIKLDLNDPDARKVIRALSVYARWKAATEEPDEVKELDRIRLSIEGEVEKVAEKGK